jgi:hypothetical protein
MTLLSHFRDLWAEICYAKPNLVLGSDDAGNSIFRGIALRCSAFHAPTLWRSEFGRAESMAAISSDELQDAWQKVKAMTILPEVRRKHGSHSCRHDFCVLTTVHSAPRTEASFFWTQGALEKQTARYSERHYLSRVSVVGSCTGGPTFNRVLLLHAGTTTLEHCILT